MTRFATCLRSHGLPDTKDPDQFGRVVGDNSSGQLNSAATRQTEHRAVVACEKFDVPMPAEVSALIDQANAAAITPAEKKMYAAYAACMQTHGAPDFPDPAPSGETGEKPWNMTSAGAKRATSACAYIIGHPATPTGPGLG